MTTTPSRFRHHVIRSAAGALALVASCAAGFAAETVAIRALVAKHAQLNAVPDSLVHRIVQRESRYNPRAHGRGHYGLMQISLPTARQMGYKGAPAGLFDAETNLVYGMPYLANAWLVSGHNEAQALRLYSRGYYYEAKRKGLLPKLRSGRKADLREVEAAR